MEFLDTLNPPQKEAARHVDGPLLILAGAGSGKTRVIVCRIANLIGLGIPPWNILAVTFTNKAAAEMRARVDTLVPGGGRGVWVSTFHAFCAKFLRIEAKGAGLDQNFVIYDDNDQLTLVKEAMKELGITDKQMAPRQILSAMSRAKDELIDAESYAITSAAQGDPFRERVAKVYTLYEKKLKAANALDFGDLIMRSVQTLRDVTTVREKYQNRFQYIMVDEYQDTNHAQYLLTKYLAGTTKNICVVGDDDQSIYSWRGATIRNILEFERDYPGAKVVKLEQNYRSTKNILDVAGRLIAHNTKRKGKTMWTESDPGEGVKFIEMMNEQEEARFVVEEAARLKQAGAEYKDIAIFYRTNAQSRVFEDAFRRMTMPYQIIGALRFYERAEVKDAIAYLRAVVNPKDTLSLKRIINVPTRGIGKNSLEMVELFAADNGLSLWEALLKIEIVPNVSPAARAGLKQFVQLMATFQSYSAQFPAGTVVRRVIEESGYWDKWASEAEDDPEAAERLDNLQELINAAQDFEERLKVAAQPGEAQLPGGEADQAPSLARYLQEISLLSDLDEWAEKGGAITLMTVHLAKGLEFPNVFVTGLEEGLFPIGDSAFDVEELEEERRLAYVAMTRAREKLYLTSAASRRIFGSPRMNIPSRFIEEAGVATVKTAMRTAPHRPAAEPDFDFNQDVPSGGAGELGLKRSVVAPAAADDDFNQDPERAFRTDVAKLAKPGRVVEHPDWGQGRISDVEGSGDAAKVTVEFFSGSRKKLLLKYAPLKFI